MPHADTPDPEEIARRFSNAAEDREVKRGYLRFFAGMDRVLDVGCGTGTFLDLLEEARIRGIGIECRPFAVEHAKSKGHDVRLADAIEGLAALAEGGERFPGVLCSHVIEHLPPPRAPSLFAGIFQVLAPGGRAVVVTPNPKNLIVLTEIFWLDPTHVRPWPRRLLEELSRAAGLEVEESFDDPATVPRRPLLSRLAARIRSALSGADRSSPLDSVVVFRRP